MRFEGDLNFQGMWFVIHIGPKSKEWNNLLAAFSIEQY